MAASAASLRAIERPALQWQSTLRTKSFTPGGILMKELPLLALISVSAHPGRKQRIRRLEQAAHEQAGVFEGGAGGYIVKPFTAATLNEKLRHILSKHGLAA